MLEGYAVVVVDKSGKAVVAVCEVLEIVLEKGKAVVISLVSS
jgi:hypothetical protein